MNRINARSINSVDRCLNCLLNIDIDIGRPGFLDRQGCWPFAAAAFLSSPKIERSRRGEIGETYASSRVPTPSIHQARTMKLHFVYGTFRHVSWL